VDETTLETLEYPAVLKVLSGFAVSPPGREAALGLRPSTDLRRVQESLVLLAEAVSHMKTRGRFALGSLTDIAPILSALKPEGSYLPARDLLPLRDNLDAGSALRGVLLDAAFERAYPRLGAVIRSIPDHAELRSHLHRIIDDRGLLRDDASESLARIRREIRAGKGRARSAVERIFSETGLKGAIQQEVVTLRDDRYVLSVKAGMQAPFKGVIHGRSASGATLFMEPMELVDLNNAVAGLARDEKAEEVEILKEAARMIACASEGLASTVRILAGLDLLQAKALMGSEMDAVVPVVRPGGDVRLKRARHPLLVAKGAAEVVPIDITMEQGCRVLVVSGANTGGKTVALKTLGLLTLMALSGMPVPLEEGSEVVAFDPVLADIGDRQSIAASLSTFSAHVRRMAGFIEAARPGALVLIDEIGAGTDPATAAALALALLDLLKEKGAAVVVTTHQSELKARAQSEPGWMNASVEFDEETLRPLYTLSYGAPGASMGLSIAEGLGMPAGLIARARERMREGERDFAESIRLLGRERAEVGELRERLARLKAEREEAVEKLRTDRAKAAERARRKIERAASRAVEEIELAAERFKTRAASSARPARSVHSLQEIRAAESKAARAITPKPASRYVPSVGESVVVSGSGTVGEVIRVDVQNRRAEVRAGPVKVWSAWERLTRSSVAPKTWSRAGERPALARLPARASLNIIGMRLAEATGVITRFIDEAHAAGLERVEIIHGIGEGVLSRAVAGLLDESPVVRGRCHGDPDRGGAGVTVAELV